MVKHLALLFFITALATFTLSASPTEAQIIIIPDCNENPEHSFCQGQCRFVRPKPPWCAQPSPTPTPKPEPNPVVIVPGMLTSFNAQTILLDEDSSNWNFFPFFGNIYRGLLERLEQADFQQNSDLFIAHYDWRQPNAESAIEYLKPVIDQAKQASNTDKVDLVTHSMGGLVARSYIQGPNYENDIDQLITLGTPHSGATDAYVAWEGGELPKRWSPATRAYVRLVETALKRTHGADLLTRPESFRTYFPFLHDLLPTSDFVTVDGIPVAVNDLTEKNLFLQNLNNTLSDLTNNVSLTTIAGTDLGTLNNISLSTNRSILDQLLDRWRDGRADPNPPPPDTSAGDKTVTLASAHIGNENLTLNNVEHDKLPEAAQEEVLQALGIEPTGSLITYDLPDSILGTVVLSPIDPLITGPTGEVLSQSENTFPDAQYVDDPTDPHGPKLLVIANPPEGEYDITLTGTDTGNYTVITTYADENETTSTSTAGTTNPGQTDTTAFSIQEETIIYDADIFALTKQLKETITQLHKDKHLTHHGKLLGKAQKLHNHAKKYAKKLDKHGLNDKKTQKSYEKLLETFNTFSATLDNEINNGHLDAAAAGQLLNLHDQIKNSI